MPKLRLNRDQLQAICGNDARAIRAFEEVFDYVGEVGPDSLDEVLALVANMRSGASAASLIQNRLAELEQMTGRRTNLTAITARLDALEQAVMQRPNLSALINRIENLEKLTGV